MKNLVIVESPAKAKTIEKYLGSDFNVLSSFGHIRDLPKKGISIDLEKTFEPTYEIPADKKKVVAALRKAAKEADTVWLASDEDREGEAISWHLCIALGLDPKTTKRIVFHEITKPAIEAAIKNPRTVDQALVDAQQARRVLDRIVGYELSPVLWKKVRTGLSAGRVQSVAVRLIVEREKEIDAFESASAYKLTASLLARNSEVNAEATSKAPDVEAATGVLEHAKTANFTVTSVEKSPGVRRPSAPFTTSTLQQEAARRLSLPVRTTMQVAQRLYESGLITYMRTDSMNLSESALTSIESYIKKAFGDQYLDKRHYKTNKAGAQEAHEAIRPTDITKLSAGADDLQKRLYSLIWQRTIASQMSKAITDKTVASISMSNDPTIFKAKGEILKFDGFLQVYGGGKEDVILPELSEGQALNLIGLESRQNYQRPPARYTEASLVKQLEDLGIGRPSTYAPTISTIQNRGYVEKGESEGNPRDIHVLKLSGGQILDSTETEKTGSERGKLLPTALAIMANDFLVKHFATIVDYDFTKEAEEGFDRIAEGQESWTKMIKDFYTKDFHPLIVASADVSRAETSQARELGIDPKSGKMIYARFGRYGPMLQIGEAVEGGEKPTFAPMPKGVRLENVTLEQALEMFKLPRLVGLTESGEEIKANIGRFGPYVQLGKLYVSIKDDDPMTISLEKARQLIADKQEAEAKKLIAEFGDIKILNGMYGPYITDGKKNAKIPKETEPSSITEDQAKQMLAEAPEKGKGRFGRGRKKAAPKTTKRVVKRKSTKKKKA
jgi:DNA topoisomerase-1